MGPYCNFCNNRCFVHFPDKTPSHILKAYGSAEIIATCAGGQAYEKKKVGYCYDDIMAAIASLQTKSTVVSLEHGTSHGFAKMPFVLAHLSCYHVIEGEGRIVGEEVDCEHCKSEHAEIQKIRERKSEIILTRYRPNFGGTYSFYRLDDTSPSGKLLFACLSANPNVEAFLKEINIAPLSPTENLTAPSRNVY